MLLWELGDLHWALCSARVLPRAFDKPFGLLLSVLPPRCKEMRVCQPGQLQDPTDRQEDSCPCSRVKTYGRLWRKLGNVVTNCKQWEKRNSHHQPRAFSQRQKERDHNQNCCVKQWYGLFWRQSLISGPLSGDGARLCSRKVDSKERLPPRCRDLHTLPPALPVPDTQVPPEFVLPELKIITEVTL